MSWLLIANNWLSFLMVLVCWWLVHQNALDREPFGRSIAAGYSILAMLVLANALFRNVVEFQSILPWSLVASKAVLVCTLALVSLRLTLLHAEPPGR